MLNIDRLKSYLNQVASDSLKVLSFDIFDTLLLRMVPPSRVAQLSANDLSQYLHNEASITLRPADIIISRNSFKRQMDKQYFYKEAEWTLSMWLTELARQHNLEESFLIRAGRQSEIVAESKCLRITEEAINALSLGRDHGLKVIAVSDMWLDQEWLKELLESFGLFFDDVFSSGSMGVSKRKGTIFKQIEKHFSFAADNFLHVGDNLKADYIRPRLAGWQSIWMPARNNRIQIRSLPIPARYIPPKKTWKEIVQALSLPPLKNKTNPYFALAYEQLSPLLIIFAIMQWRKFREQKIDIAFYIARDAKVMFDVYNIIEHLLPGSCPRSYIRLSRRTIAIAHPDNLLQNVTHIAGKIGKNKVHEWLNNFTISSELRQEILLLAKVDAQDDFTESVYNSLRAACRELSAQITEEQNLQKQLIKDYLVQQARNVPLQKVGIVDSGWACTTQDSLRTVLDSSEVISGMYFGVSMQGQKPNIKNLKYGLLRDDFRKCSHHNPLESTAGVIRVWDTILREPCGTTLKLKRQSDGKIEPLLAKEKTLKKLEHAAAEAISQGVLEGTTERMKGVSLLVQLVDHFSDTDFETAATVIAKNISSQPTCNIAKAIMQLGFDEGGADENRGTLNGMDKIKGGVAWYPGILSSLGLRWMVPVLEVGATKALKIKLKGL